MKMKKMSIGERFDFFGRSVRVFRQVCGLTAIAGFIIAILTREPEWFSRFGTILVVLSLCLTLVQFLLESELPTHIEQLQNEAKIRLEERGESSEEAEVALAVLSRGLREKYERSRYRILITSLITAAIGELLHGFGDLVVAGLFKLVALGSVAAQH